MGKRAGLLPRSLVRGRASSAYHPSLRSRQVGFCDSISLIFFSLRHPLICFSASIAD